MTDIRKRTPVGTGIHLVEVCRRCNEAIATTKPRMIPVCEECSGEGFEAWFAALFPEPTELTNAEIEARMDHQQRLVLEWVRERFGYESYEAVMREQRKYYRPIRPMEGKSR